MKASKPAVIKINVKLARRVRKVASRLRISQKAVVGLCMAALRE